MADANVKSLDAVERFANDISGLRTSTRKITDEIREQLQRVTNWMEKELPEYWRNELRLAEKRWVEAREDLLRCEAKSRAEDETQCSVQRKALARAAERKSLCEQRTRLIPELALEWGQFIQESSTQVRQLDDLAESTLQTAHNQLLSTIETLKKYMQT
ncbi:MAG: hypothetical protein KGQ60_05130 [Planctomycetes bacterium]|nr:hypothetical protein [Planctomycetota bacterium]